MQISKNNIAVLMFALTLKDRVNKNKKTREKWLSKGFKKISRQRLLDYWIRRINSNSKDFELYKEVLLSYEKTNYRNVSAPNSTVKIDIAGIDQQKLPRLLFNNLIINETEKEYKRLTNSILHIFSQLLNIPKEALELIDLKLQIKDKNIIEFLEDRLEKKIASNIQPLINKTLGDSDKPTTNLELPSVWDMAKNAGKAAIKSAKSGFKTVTDEQYAERTAICKSCEFWNPAAFNNTGQCVKCGCSTKAKLKLATESCPIQKWSATIS